MSITQDHDFGFGCSSDGSHVDTHRIHMSRDSGISWSSRTLRVASSWIHSANFLLLVSSISIASCSECVEFDTSTAFLLMTVFTNGLASVSQWDASFSTIGMDTLATTVSLPNNCFAKHDRYVVATPVSVVDGTLATPCDRPRLGSWTHFRVPRRELLCLSDSCSVDIACALLGFDGQTSSSKSVCCF